MDGGLAANGQYDLQFKLYDTQIGGSLLGTIVKDEVHVTQNIFTVTLDYRADVFYIVNGQRTKQQSVFDDRRFLEYDPLTPTATGTVIRGRVTNSGGQGISNVRIQLIGGSLSELRNAITGSFGYFQFTNVPVGEIYVLTIYSKRFVFPQPTQIIRLNDDLTDVTFTAGP